MFKFFYINIFQNFRKKISYNSNIELIKKFVPFFLVQNYKIYLLLHHSIEQILA